LTINLVGIPFILFMNTFFLTKEGLFDRAGLSDGFTSNVS